MIRPVWLLVTGVATCAGLAVVALAESRALEGTPFTLRWWALAPLFYLTERTVIHLRFNRHAHSFSLSEMPIVLALHFAAPVDMIGGQVIGTLLALGLTRRQSPVKLAFNVGQLALQAATASFVFRAVLGGTSPLGLADAAGTFLAVIAALVVADLLVNLAIRLSGGRLSAREMLDVIGLGAVAALMNAALALVAVHIVWFRPESAWIAAVPPAVLFVAYRAYVTQRQERTRVAAVYEVTKELHRTPQIEAALKVAAAKAREVFDAEAAQIILLPEGGDHTALVTAHGPGTEGRAMERIDTSDVDPVALATMEIRSGILEENGRMMAAPLFERDSAIGVFVVMDPVGEVGTFGPTDLTMLETLAGQVSVSLENGRLEDSLAQLTRLKEELHHQALHDGLTGLANRRLLQDRVAEAVERSGAGYHSALLFLDLDDFKEVNDTQGHQAGDELLRMAADRLQSACRPGDTVARIGGDEFAVLLVGMPRPHEAENVAERILETLGRPFTVRGQPVFISASLGIAHIGTGDDCDDILRRADQAMYGAKWHEKGSYEVYADSMSEGVRRWIELRSSFRESLADASLELHYQPVVDLDTERVVGAEALLRWSHPRLGPVDPIEALSVADELGLMGDLAAWTVERVCADLAEVRSRAPDIWMSMNAAVNQLDPGLVDTVAEALARHRLEPAALVIEITETAATQSSGAILEKLAALGVRIALDDFGTGYSSLARLDTLPIDILKIDRTFVNRLDTPDGSPLIQIVVDIGATLSLTTIAEGIETEDQRDRLRRLGCTTAQGYLYSPAVPIDRLASVLTDLPWLTTAAGTAAR